jgi:hypothetical protein
VIAYADCLRCSWQHGPTRDLDTADREARRHTGDGIKGGPRHPTRCQVTPDTTAPGASGAVSDPTHTEGRTAP